MENSKKQAIGASIKSDNRFTHQARMLQGWYRAFVLKIPQGYGPTINSKKLLPNMIPAQKDGFPKYNFLNDMIYQDVIQRIKRKDIGGTIETFRLFHNMLSSQPMAFNLFSPLSTDLQLASRVFKKIYPNLEQVINIIIEFTPRKNKEYLGDRTAFDVFVEYLDNSNRKCFIGIEMKYTEKFSPTQYVTPIYEELTNLPSSPFSKDANELKKYNQLWRNMLLAYSMLIHPQTEYHSANILLVYMKEDCHVEEMLPGFISCLKHPSEWFIALDVRQFVDVINLSKLNSVHRQWIEEFSLRYFQFDMVEGL